MTSDLFDLDREVAEARTLANALDVADKRHGLISAVISSAMYAALLIAGVLLWRFVVAGHPAGDSGGNLMACVFSFLIVVFLIFCARSFFLVTMDRRSIRMSKTRLSRVIAEAEKRYA